MSRISSIKFLIIVLFFSVIIQLILIATSNENKKIYIVFRMDDYSDNSNLKIEEKIFETFSELSIPLIVGIVPFTTDEEKRIVKINHEKIDLISHYKNQNLFNFALHGYTHKNNSNDKRFKYEFNYLPLDTQSKILIEGKNFLESITGRKIDIFIPPWNGYDSNTIYALKKTRFKIISAGIRGFSIDSDIKYLPLTTTIKELKEVFQQNVKIRLKDVLIVVNIHSYEFENLEDINEMKDLLIELKYNKKFEFSSTEKNILLTSQLLDLNKKFQYLLSLIPKFWASFSGYHSFYLTTENNLTSLETIRFLLTFFNYMIFIFLVSSLFFYHFLKKLFTLKYIKIISIFVFLIFIVFSIFIFSNLRINYKGVTILISFFGILTSFLIILRKDKNNMEV